MSEEPTEEEALERAAKQIVGDREISIWDNRSPVFKALVHTILFFFAPAAVAVTFSENMVIRFLQTMDLTGLILIRHDLAEKTVDRGGAE